MWHVQSGCMMEDCGIHGSSSSSSGCDNAPRMNFVFRVINVFKIVMTSCEPTPFSVPLKATSRKECLLLLLLFFTQRRGTNSFRCNCHNYRFYHWKIIEAWKCKFDLSHCEFDKMTMISKHTYEGERKWGICVIAYIRLIKCEYDCGATFGGFQWQSLIITVST